MKILAVSALLLLSACGSHEDTPSSANSTSNAITVVDPVDPMANAMDGSALQAVGDLMESPDVKAVMGGPSPKTPTTPAGSPPATTTVPTTPPAPAP